MSQEHYRNERFGDDRPYGDRYRNQRGFDYRDQGPIREAASTAVDSLRHARDHAFDSVTEPVYDMGRRARDASYRTSSFVGTHAVPLALLGVGLGMLMASVNRQRAGETPNSLTNPSLPGSRRAVMSNYRSQPSEPHTSSLGETASELAEAARRRVGALADRATHGLEGARDQLRETVHAAQGRVEDGLSELRHQASSVRQQASEIGNDLLHQASDVGQQTYEQLKRAQQRTQQLVEDNPVVVGALAVVAGVGVGLMLPATRSENQLLGGPRDRLLDEAQRTASRFAETAQQSAEELKSALLDPPAHS